MHRAFFLFLLIWAGFAPLGFAQPPETAVTAPDAVRARYLEELTDPAYHDIAPPGLLERLGDWLAHWMTSLDSAFRNFRYAEQLSRFSAFMMWVILVVGLAAVIYWAARLIRSQRLELDASAPRAVGTRYFSPPESYEPEIERAVLGQDWSTALLFGWRRFLAQLERKELVEADRTRTNWEYLGQLRGKTSHPAAPEILQVLAEQYDRVVYGSAPFGAEDWNRFRRQLDDLTHLLHLNTSHPVSSAA
jgi:hypothetical protein